MSKTITVFGASAASGAVRGSESYAEARRLGRLLAEAGYTVCNGGYSGTMEAAARGAREAGGRTIGVTAAQFDPAKANAYIDDERKAPDLFARLTRLLALGDAYVCLRGGIGTLTEFSLAWTLLQTRALARRPFVCVGPAWKSLLDAYRQCTLIRPKDFRLVTLADSVEDAVAHIATCFG